MILNNDLAPLFDTRFIEIDVMLHLNVNAKATRKVLFIEVCHSIDIRWKLKSSVLSFELFESYLVHYRYS